MLVGAGLVVSGCGTLDKFQTDTIGWPPYDNPMFKGDRNGGWITSQTFNPNENMDWGRKNRF